MDVGSTQTYLGNPFPTREWSFSPRLTLFSLIQLSALVDHRGGFKIYNLTERFRCNFSNCRAAYDPAAGLYNQARNLGQLMNTDAGYIEDGTYTKLREVAVTLTAPSSWTSRLGTEQLSLTLAGKNLAVWTDYTGFDPEVNSTPGGNFNTSDFLTQPPLRIWTVRLNLAF
jgi:hypothetical protein